MIHDIAFNKQEGSLDIIVKNITSFLLFIRARDRKRGEFSKEFGGEAAMNLKAYIRRPRLSIVGRSPLLSSAACSSPPSIH